MTAVDISVNSLIYLPICFFFCKWLITSSNINCDSFNRFILSDVVCYVCLDIVLIKVCKHMRVFCRMPINHLITYLLMCPNSACTSGSYNTTNSIVITVQKSLSKTSASCFSSSSHKVTIHALL